MAQVYVRISDKPTNVRDMVAAQIGLRDAMQEVGGSLQPVATAGHEWSKRAFVASVPDSGAGVAVLQRAAQRTGYAVSSRTIKGVSVLSLQPRG